MTEKAEKYEVGQARRAIVCECGNPLWDEVIVGNTIYLVVGGGEDHNGIVMFHYSGACRRCWRPLEWHCNQVRLEKLVERVMEGRGRAQE